MTKQTFDDVTQDMRCAGHSYILQHQKEYELSGTKPDVQDFCEGLYRAMFAAAPKPAEKWDQADDALYLIGETAHKEGA